MAVDPIAELVRDLTDRGRPTLAWVTRWSAEGREPVAAAWARAQRPEQLVALLAFAAHPGLEAARRTALAPMIWPGSDADPVRCDAIRAAVPEPPTLVQLIHVAAGRARIFCLLGGNDACTAMGS